MPFPEAIAKAQRNGLLGDVTDAMDACELIWRTLSADDVKPHLFALDAKTFDRVTRFTKQAYEDLFEARALIEEVGDDS